jgi:hypothetical protein
MRTEYFFSSADFGKWKQQVRRLKRVGGLPHHQALEQVAKSLEFDNWHHVVTEAKLNLVSETAYRSGLIVAYDIKAAMEGWEPDDAFVDEHRAMYFCKKDVFAWYRRNDDEAEGAEREAIPSDPVEYREEFEMWLGDLWLFRYCGSELPPTPAKVLPLVSERCFSAPLFFWHCGKFIDPWRDLAVDGVLDMSGNTLPNSAH